MNRVNFANSLPIVETFHSLQGEGTWMGTNAFFIRLAGCDVGCPWCDTKISWNMKRHPQIAIADLVKQAIVVKPAIVVITGGEPLMHDLTELTAELKTQGLRVHLETSGSHPFSGNFDWVTFSPKRFKPPHASIYERVNELKIVVKDASDLIWAEHNAEKVAINVMKYLQAEWETPSSKDLVLQYVLSHANWCVSIQTHKLLGVR
ncbi:MULTISPECIES: 7-carboxy-7-deazaguanine synthase QueE [Pseudanabaena]|uniref:7-carboxy-7-deazaguanine synthase n=2 Tax=Pseudanabaena TaxID=1152 RepID=L8MUL7_9CYAN|nr:MULTISPECIES: 7-carboxy-7-deazaguanine synthase QueE [Pseudanabaena]ELS31657.1 Radical SAM domain protein [Pseudanabaena biceps PCC 7429]MDG3496091.1 7-carboxy-7-deazaguanine synthase QueE [Pseudanabaena catenata USMAC16]